MGSELCTARMFDATVSSNLLDDLCVPHWAGLGHQAGRSTAQVLEATDSLNAPETVSVRTCVTSRDFEKQDIDRGDFDEDSTVCDGNVIDTQDSKNNHSHDDNETVDGGDGRVRPAAKGKKKKNKQIRPKPGAQGDAFGLSDAIALLDSFCAELGTGKGINDSLTQQKGWARDLQRIEDRVATFGHYGGVCRGIWAARDSMAVPIVNSGDLDSGEDVDWFGTGFCWDRFPRKKEGRLPADSHTAAKTAEEASKQKQEGNEALMAGLLDEAIRRYDAAQKTIGRHCKQYMDCGGESRANLVSISVALSNNTALASIRLAERVEKEEGAAAAIELYFDAVIAAKESLALDADNAKAKHRVEGATAKVDELQKSLEGTRGGV
jgi:hypothetical protein